MGSCEWFDMHIFGFLDKIPNEISRIRAIFMSNFQLATTIVKTTKNPDVVCQTI